MVQWVRIHLAMQGIRVRSLIGETKMPCVEKQWSPCAATTEPSAPEPTCLNYRVCAPQWRCHMPQLRLDTAQQISKYIKKEIIINRAKEQTIKINIKQQKNNTRKCSATNSRGHQSPRKAEKLRCAALVLWPSRGNTLSRPGKQTNSPNCASSSSFWNRVYSFGTQRPSHSFCPLLHFHRS